ncbi:MAG: NYN domain-containing protein [Clostridiales bacterium]|jgi:uncharacterized LabA/DUF88 family protein|nr:NYN domain-containing protein [Clostridiales bacterium]
MVCNTAIFYDVENLLGLFSGRNNTVIQLDEIYRRILDVDGVLGVSVQKAYTDWAAQINRNLRYSVLQVGIEPVQVFNTNQNDRIKNAADVNLIIDAVELLGTRPDIENYVIVSGDGIFAFLAKKLHEHGKRVIGCGFSKNSNIIFRSACDYFIALEKSDKSLTATSIRSTFAYAASVSSGEQNGAEAENDLAAVSAPPADNGTTVQSGAGDVVTVNGAPLVNAKPGPKRIPNSLPKNKFSEALINADIPICRNLNDTHGALLVIRDLMNALFAIADDDNTDIEISVFKTYVDFYVPGLKLSMYKFKRFGEFIRFVVTNSPYSLYQAEGTTLKIARRGMVGNKGTVMPDMRGLEITLPDGSKVNSIFNVPEGMSFLYAIMELPNGLQRQQRGRKQQDGKKKGKQQSLSENAAEREGMEPGDRSPDTPVEAPPETVAAPAGEAAASEGEAETAGDGSIRKQIKATFVRISSENALPPGEVRRLLTTEYSLKTFGIKAPVFKEVTSHSGLNENRTVNGKIKYWKEFFKFNNKTYIIYKEWTAALHRERFEAWLEKIAKRKAN